MESSFSGVCILVYVFFAVHVSASITSISPDQLAQLTHKLISKKPTAYLDPLVLLPDENDQYVDDIVRLSKRDASLNSISVVDLVKDTMSFQPSKKTIRSAKQKPEKSRDIVLEVVRKMIEKEKARRQFELVNPPSSKYTKKQQLLWDRLRIKAAQEMLLHQKPVVQRATEKLFNNFKMDQKEEEPDVTLGPELFSEFKKIVEKEYYKDQTAIGRLYISTLKPVY